MLTIAQRSPNYRPPRLCSSSGPAVSPEGAVTPSFFVKLGQYLPIAMLTLIQWMGAVEGLVCVPWTRRPCCGMVVLSFSWSHSLEDKKDDGSSFHQVIEVL